MILMTLGPPIP